MFRILAAAAVILATPAGAQTMLGDLHIATPMLRATPPNAPVAGGFLTIENRGAEDDILIAARVDGAVAAEMQLHEMAMENGVMSMFEVEGGIAVPAGETVILRPGGLHLMLMGLPEALAEGDSHEITLTFAQAGELALDFPVLSLGDIRAALGDEAGDGDAEHGGMKHGDGEGHAGHGN